MAFRDTSKVAGINLVLGISISIGLLASVVLPTFSLEAGSTTYTRFDGNDFLDTPSSPGLQLAQFTVEARLRVSQMPSGPGFLVSKGAAGTGDIFAQNYGLFVTKDGKLGGALKADDGTTYAVYSGLSIVGNGWHTARVVYDAKTLKLKLDGIIVDSKVVGKNPDVDGNGPMRIGANANSQSNFFVGDIDYVKILDRATFKKVFFNDLGGGTDPNPDPNPDPDPNPVGDGCADAPMSKFRGAVFMDPILSATETGGSTSVPLNYVANSMEYMKLSGMNLARVPFYWEGYVNNPTAFLNEIEFVAQEAKANNICVIFDNHHWYTTSYWNIEIPGNSDGRGFPSFVVKNFPMRNNDYESTARPFWTAFLSNNISINGRSVWDMQADLFAKIVSRVDGYKSVVGYEILNEPHLFDPSQYELLGDYHTYMAKKIRTMTDKKIFFDRETARGFPREPSSEYKVVPKGVPDVVYGPHIYSAPFTGSQAEGQLENFAQWSKEWDMEILVGEWSAEDTSETDAYLKAFKEKGFGWTYYSWKPTQSRGGGNTLYDSPTADPTEALRQLKYSISKTYGWG